jgi:two-component system LytT family sensor kinase
MGELLNLVGLSLGVALYTMLLVMVVRSGRGQTWRSRVDPLLLVMSLLGLVWNLFALPAYELPKVGITGPFPFLVAVGFCALGFLPAVVVHSVIRGDREGGRGRVKRSIAAVAYVVSVVAATLQLEAAWTGARVPSRLGMEILTYTFVALILPLAAVTRGQPGARRALWVAALAAFAVSALHLSRFHDGGTSWPVELLGHHASVPLAFAILYQDYPFALADLFLKRALALLALVIVTFTAVATLGAESSAMAQLIDRDPWRGGVIVAVWLAVALLYPILRRGSSWFVDAIVLRRPDYRSLRNSIARMVQEYDDVSTILAEVCRVLAPALTAREVTWHEYRLAADDDINDASRMPPASNLVVVPTGEPLRYAIRIGDLMGGRRLLSDDLRMLEAVATLVARRIDAIRITNERYDRELREEEIGKLATEAELRALRAQINPHFLFNALTTIGYLIEAAPVRALETLMRLTALLRAVLRSEGEFTSLERELDVVESYLDIERARFEERLRVTIDVPKAARGIRIPPLILQPLVENAVKHGIAKKQRGGEITVRARLRATGTSTNDLVLTVIDTGAGTTAETIALGRAMGVGLRNVERRLECQYGRDASVSVRTAPGEGTVVELHMPVRSRAADRDLAETIS